MIEFLGSGRLLTWPVSRLHCALLGVRRDPLALSVPRPVSTSGTVLFNNKLVAANEEVITLWRN